MANYAVVRTDNLYGTDVRAGQVSLKYFDSDTAAAIENGMVVKLGDLISGEREVFKTTAPDADSDFNDIVLVATPEVMYDERKKNLHEYINEADKISRGYILKNGDRYSVTIEALDGKDSPEVGDLVELQDGTKLNVVASATSGSTQVGRIIAIEEEGGYKYYVIFIKHS